MGKQPRVWQLVGYSNSGKTTLLTKLIPLLEQAGVRVGVIKHDGGHDFEWDQPEKDTWRYREAGASLVAITSKTKTAIVEQRPSSLSHLAERLTQAGADLVLVEGFKREDFPKLVVVREPQDQELLQIVSNVRAMVTWESVDDAKWPQFDVNDVEAIAHFIRLQDK